MNKDSEANDPDAENFDKFWEKSSSGVNTIGQGTEPNVGTETNEDFGLEVVSLNKDEQKEQKNEENDQANQENSLGTD